MEHEVVVNSELEEDTGPWEELLEKAGQMEAGICGVLDPKEQAQLWNLERKLLNQLSGGECDENSENNRQEVYLP